MSDLYTTRTASLRATKGDFNKIILKNKNILDYISEATPTAKHAQDTRETVTENDLWGQYIETKSDGTIIVHDDEVTNPNGKWTPWNESITKVENNKAYVDNAFYANIQTEKIKNSGGIFYNCSNLNTFSSNLSNLTDGEYMFYGCENISTFTSSLDNLTTAWSMFYNCTNLISFSTDLPNLIDGTYMFENCENLQTFDANLSNLKDGYYMFDYCTNLTTFKSNLFSLADGEGMFENCENLIKFESDLPNLMYAYSMFYSCTGLKSFISDLSNLVFGSNMFNWCTNLTSFNSDLSNLTFGVSMFENCENLTSFDSNLPNLAISDSMFKNCGSLKSFQIDLHALTNGYGMFQNCSNLTSFNSDLSNLIYAYWMFKGCKLDAESIMFIADAIKDINAERQLYIDKIIPYVTITDGIYSAYKGFMENGNYVYSYNHKGPHTTEITNSNIGHLALGIDVINDSATIDQQLEDFAKKATFDSWDDLKAHFVKKGWTQVIFEYNGSSDSSTYDLRNRRQTTPCPIFAKLVEANEETAQFSSEDKSTFYNIEWGHDVVNPTEYLQFNSLEDAMSCWNVFHYENTIKHLRPEKKTTCQLRKTLNKYSYHG